MSVALLVFNEEGRLTLWNKRYIDLFKASLDFLKTEPLLMDVLDSQKNSLVLSDDIWDLMKPKILMFLEDENYKMSLNLVSDIQVELIATHLPDGGLLLRYE